MDDILRSVSFILVYGVSYGTVLFMVSIGLMLTLGLMRVLNLAHGAFAAIGGYVAVSAMQSFGVGFLASAGLAALTVAFLSVAVERLFFIRLYKSSELDQVLMSIGLIFLTVGSLNLLFGPDLFQATLPAWLTSDINLGVRSVQAYRVVVVLIGLFLVVALWLLFDRTSFGAALRAGVDNRSMAEAMGINVGRLFSVAFALGAGLAALGGAVGFPMLPMEPLYPLKYIAMVLIVVSLAGFGNLKAAAPAAIVVGVVDTAARFLLPEIGAFAVYALFIGVMAFRSGGSDHGSGVNAPVVPAREFGLAEVLFWLGLILAFFLLPNHLSLATSALVMALFALSLDLILGFAGVITLGHGIYFGIGAFSAAWIGMAGWREPVTALILSGLVAAITAALIGPLLLKKRGMPLIMISFVLSLIFYEAANKASFLTGGDSGLGDFRFAPLFGVFDWSVYAKVEYLYVLSCLFVFVFIAKRLVTSPFGLALKGIRENSERMPFVGAPVLIHLIKVYVLSAFMAGAAGAIYAQTTRFVSLSVMHFEISINGLVMLILGGIGTLYGAIVGAVVYIAVHHMAAEWNPYHWMFIIGILLVAVVRFGEGGVLGVLRYLNQSLDRRGASVRS